MPDYLKRTGRDVTEDTTIRIPEAEKTISRLRGPASKRPSIDRGSIPSVAAPFEGQMMIQYADQAVGATPVSPDVGSTFNGEQPYYYSNGKWRPFVTGIEVSSAEEWLEVVSVSILGASSTQLTWAHLAGPSLVDLTTPTQPEVATAGVYIMDATAVVLSNSSTHNHFQLIGNVVQAAYTGSVHAQDAYSDVAGDAIEAALSMAGKMAAADSFTLQIFNFDTAARNFSCPSVRITKLF